MQHGFTDSLASWYDNGYVDPLKHDYRLILIDARGHGDSDKPHSVAAYGMQHRVADIVAVLAELRTNRAHFFGYSMGGWVGFGMAKYARDRLSSLIIGGANAAPRMRQSHPLLDPKLTSKVAAAIADSWDAPLPPALHERILKNDMGAIRAAVADDPGYEDILPTIAVPSLLLAGDKDPIYPMVRANAARIPHAQFITIPGENHAGALFRSDLMVSHITQFLRGLA